MDLFVKDGNQTYKVNYICMCNECRKRGMPELELVDQEGNYVDYIKMSCLFNGKYELFQKTNKRSEKYVANFRYSYSFNKWVCVYNSSSYIVFFY